MTKVEEVARGIFAPIDRVVANMPPVANACSTCGYAEIPPMPEDLEDGWIAHCKAPTPVNVLLSASEVKMSFAAAEAARWGSKRQRPCPCWIDAALNTPTSGLGGAVERVEGEGR